MAVTPDDLGRAFYEELLRQAQQQRFDAPWVGDFESHETTTLDSATARGREESWALAHVDGWIDLGALAAVAIEALIPPRSNTKRSEMNQQAIEAMEGNNYLDSAASLVHHDRIAPLWGFL